jgi:succinyl-diaminopimelate desuccinylase
MSEPVRPEPAAAAWHEIDAAIDSEVVVDYARELVRRPSVNPPGDCREPAGWVKAAMTELGLDVSVVEGKADRPNIVGRLAGTGGGDALCLSAHTDVVGVGDVSRWAHDPFAAAVEDGRLYGRGSMDSKGPLAAMLAAAGGIIRSGVKLAGDLYVIAPVDDETAGEWGLRYVFDQGAVPARHVIYGEATDFRIKHIYKSRLWFDLELLGRSAHGAYPDKGINAIDKAYDAIAAIRAMELRSDPIVGPDTVNVGVIRGGDQVNKVCDQCSVSFDVRWGPGRSSDEVRLAIDDALRKAAERDPDFEMGQFVVTERREPLSFDATGILVASALAAGEQLLGQDIGDDPGWLSSGDLFWLWKNGHIDSGIVWGPGDPAQAHVIDEHIEIDQLVLGARAYALAALGVCGTEIS